MFDWMGDFFKSLIDIIPKMIYLLYSSLACLLDIFQLVFRKLAGLDVYYDAQGNAISGDIVTNFIAGMFGININGSRAHFDYSPLATVFWSMVVFGVIITFVAVFVAIIKSHYNYDEKAAKGPMQYVYTGLKALINIAVVPVIVILGLFVSQAILTALDSITSNTAATISEFDTNNLESAYTTRGQASGREERTYVFYDLFGYECGIKYGQNSTLDDEFSWGEREKLAMTASTTTTFSGALFRTAAYNGNRARTGQISKTSVNIYGFENDGIFGAQLKDNLTNQAWADKAANMIDTAFANNFHLNTTYLRNHREALYEGGGANDWTSAKYMLNFFTKSIPSFSKFNVGAVWYYYDLWNFNFIVGFGACVVCVSLFVNIILGLITRIFLSVGLFLIAPPLFGLAPFDDGKAAKSWRENFVKQVLMAYGAVVGMNIFFIILPIMNQINFFNIAIADLFMQTLIIIVGLVTIKAFISTVSGLIGAEDANKAGEGIKEDTFKTMATGAKMLGGAATMPFKVAQGAVHGALAVKNFGQMLSNRSDELNNERLAKAAEQGNKDKNKLMKSSFNKIKTGKMDLDAFKKEAAKQGLDDDKAEQMFSDMQASTSLEEARELYAKSGKDDDYANNVKAAQPYKKYAAFSRELKNRASVRMSTHMGIAGSNLSSPLSFLSDFAKNDKGYKAFMDTIDKPKDYAKLNYQEAKKLREGMLGYNDESKVGPFKISNGHKDGAMETLNKNVGGLNANVQEGFAGTQGALSDVRTDMNTGFAGTQGAVTSMHGDVNTRLDSVNHNADEIRKATRTIQSHTRKLKSEAQQISANTSTMRSQLYQVNVDMANAEKARDEALKKQDELVKEAQEITKKIK